MTETPKNHNGHLTSGRLLAKNTVWNLLGQLLPIAVGLVAVPPLVRGLGVDRFGLLSLAWIVIGYFNLFDLGMGRALTKLVSDKLGADEEHGIPPLAWTSLLLMLLLGIAGSVVALGFSRWLVHFGLKLPAALEAEALTSFLLLTTSIPVVIVTSGLRGILEAQQRFRLLNLIRIPTSIFSLAGPLLVLPFSRSLVPVVATLIVGRLIGGFAHLAACFYYLPALRRNFTLDRSIASQVLRLGSWMTVTNIVGPAILYSDRFIIGALLSVSAVSYYTVPFDMVSRLTLISASISGVLFPAFALSAARDEGRTALLLDRGLKSVFLLIYPLTLIIVTLAPEILRVWLSATFAQNSGWVLRWLAAGIFMNCLSVIPFTLLQGIGYADITGKMLLIDLPISLAAVWLMTMRLGVLGAAIVWTMRATLETTLLFALSHYYLQKTLTPLKQFGLSVTAAFFVLYIGTLFNGLELKCIFLVCALPAFVCISWLLVLRPDERSFLARGCLAGKVILPTTTILADRKE